MALGQAERVRAWLLSCCWLLSSAAVAQDESDFALPTFRPDAGSAPHSLPSPPLPPLEAAPLPQPAPLHPQEPERPAAWNRASASAEGVLSGFRDFYAGVEVFAAGVKGTLEVVESAPDAFDPRLRRRDVRGWLLVPGVLGLWSRLSGPVCAGSDFCGERWGAGGAVRFGHATGIAFNDGSVQLTRFLFGQATVQGVFVTVPPAPLTRGSRWGELVLRASFGVQLNTATGRQRTRAGGIVVQLSGFFEYLFFNPVGAGPQLGLTLGVGL
jgi:hypothetical protein